MGRLEAMTTETPTERAATWLAQLGLGASLARSDIPAAVALFGGECFWRDHIAFTWNIKTMEGREEIADMLAATLPATRPTAWKVTEEASIVDGVIEAWFSFETAVGRGVGLLRLKDGLGWTILTTLRELKGHEEARGANRPKGAEHRAIKGRLTWREMVSAEEAALGTTKQPYCVVVGGGQSGIAVGARLKRLGVPTVILEKHPRAGDSWRNRYDSLVLHDPVWFDHFPYMPFPDHWPVYTPKDQLGDWLEMYVKVMGLNYWTSSECLGAQYDDETKEWTVRVRRDGREVTLRPKALVLASGFYGPPNETKLPGSETFAGVQMHSSAYVNGRAFAGKKCVVVGANSSGHDVAADLWESGADVTMIQRSPTIVLRMETMMKEGFASLYSEEAVAKGITTDRADLIFASTPIRVWPRFQIPLYKKIREDNAEFYRRLEKAGFMLDFGEDGSGQMLKAYRTGSGYYLDVGASELIASGEIKLKAGVEPVRLDEHSMTLSDGTVLPADAIFYATGFKPMSEWVAQLISREVADKIGRTWGYGSGMKGDPGPWVGELRNMWMPLAQPALWFHGGNLALSRHYSLYVALQIKARSLGLPTPVYGEPLGP
jgi:putative flavoprotein involved in K+ transport